MAGKRRKMADPPTAAGAVAGAEGQADQTVYILHKFLQPCCKLYSLTDCARGALR